MAEQIHQLESQEKEAHNAMLSALHMLARAEVYAERYGRDPETDLAIKDAQEKVANKRNEAIEASRVLIHLQRQLEAHKT